MCPESGTRLALFTEVCGLPIHALSQIFRPFPASSLIPELRRTGRAGRRVDVFLGLKPQAESFCPFGAEIECSRKPL